MFEVLKSFIPLLFSVVVCVHVYVSQYFKAKSDSGRCEENLLVIQVGVCYILKHLEDRKA